MSKKDGGSTQGYMNAEQAPVITAEPGPYKIPPTDPAGMKIDGLDGSMYTAGEGIDTGSNIDPNLAAETPLPRPGTPGATGAPRELVPEGVSDPIPPIIAPATPRTATPPAASVVTVKPPAPVAKPAPGQAPGPAPTPTRPAAAAPRAEAPRPDPARSEPARPDAAKANPGKAGTVQLGAFSSEDKANAAWASLAGKHGLAGKRIVTVESGGKTLYRLRAASGDTAATCAKLKAAGDACAAVE
ncbi:hypothetical protein F3168_10295 [Polymorphobacter fuscus]|uniref:SPOR domain-containing protein n=2 Tax=Sandarakinorhabdus fusca TaxID=1439888 RepID=A0A7C9GS63_9SPHN|nr:SPOR domain-containing protein [Polymorphobacter fuscus]MQT17651.1 hypothetical protein [Polymorphobacter fuscus]